MDSEYGDELHILISHFVNTHLRITGRVNERHIIDLDLFTSLIGNKTSCLVDEIKLKLTSPAGSLKKKSVFLNYLGSLDASPVVLKGLSRNSFRLKWGEDSSPFS